MPLRSPFTEFIVVGLGKNNRKFHHFKDGDNLTLIPEPQNTYDPNAIKVLVDNNFVGYVSKDNTKQIHKFLNRESHIFDFYLINKYSASARWLMIDLTLSLKRKNNEIIKPN